MSAPMNWLRDNAFIAEWIALPIALLAAYLPNKGKPASEIEWEWVLIYITFGITLPVALSHGFDQYARDFAKWLAMFAFIAIIFNRRRG